jgi:hypothetical protein
MLRNLAAVWSRLRYRGLSETFGLSVAPHAWAEAHWRRNPLVVVVKTMVPRPPELAGLGVELTRNPLW